MPTDYVYTMHFYGPYSEGLQSEIGMLEEIGLVEEDCQMSSDGTPYYVLSASEKADLKEIESFRPYINLMSASDATVLELAATYDAFREMNHNHADALLRLQQKKGSKCKGGREEQALELLKNLGLPCS